MKIFDSHFHIINPGFPLYENNGFLPDYFSTADYLQCLNRFNLEAAGGVVVSASFQGFDQTYLPVALEALGENYVAVAQLTVDTPLTDLEKLHQLGVRGVRFNLYRGLTLPFEAIQDFSRKVYDYWGWNTQFYLDLHQLEDHIFQGILKLPRVTVDHLGMSAKAQDRLYQLAAQGARIKATGFGRIDFDELTLKESLLKIHQISPQALMFGSDLPSTRARRPFQAADIQLMTELFSKTELEQIFYHNAYDYYILGQ